MTNGLFFDGGNAFLILLNTNSFTETTIVHETYHLLQTFKKCKKYKEINTTEKYVIQFLKLSKQDIECLFNEKEFEAHIKVDLINQLEEIYFKFYKNISKQLFILHFIASCKCIFNENDFYKNEYVNHIMYDSLTHDSLTEIRLQIASFLFKYDKFVKDAEKWITESFKK